MKKLLSMVLAMVLLCASMASMGVMASGTVIMSYGFEAEEDKLLGGALFDNINEGVATVLDSTVNTSEPIKPVSGTKYLRLDNTTTTRKKLSAYDSRMPKLDAKSRYKLSFYWHGNENFEYPAVNLSGPIKMNNYTRTNYIFPKTAKDAWMKIEVYFVTDDTLAEEQKLGIQLYTASGTEYYDDFKLEKVDRASIRFISGTPSLTQDNTLTNTVQGNTTRYGYYQPKNTYSIGNEKPYIWPAASSGIEAKTCTGNEDINIVSHYLPKAIGEKTILIAAIYKDINGVPTLQGIKVNDTCEYITTSIAQTTALAAHNRMDLGFDTLTISASELEAGCYIECFMWSSVSGMIPLSDVATLPAATTTAQ